MPGITQYPGQPRWSRICTHLRGNHRMRGDLHDRAAFHDIAEASAAIRARRVSPVELTQSFLNRIKA
jgi:hypothetical protein